MWDIYQRLKCLLSEANLQISHEQHRDWYITLPLPHLILSLSQQKTGSQVEQLEITMNLEASLIQDTNVGVQQIQAQLASLHMELQDLKNGKEVKSKTHSEVWCTKCKVEGHHKD